MTTHTSEVQDLIGEIRARKQSRVPRQPLTDEMLQRAHERSRLAQQRIEAFGKAIDAFEQGGPEPGGHGPSDTAAAGSRHGARPAAEVIDVVARRIHDNDIDIERLSDISPIGPGQR